MQNSLVTLSQSHKCHFSRRYIESHVIRNGVSSDHPHISKGDQVTDLTLVRLVNVISFLILVNKRRYQIEYAQSVSGMMKYCFVAVMDYI